MVLDWLGYSVVVIVGLFLLLLLMMVVRGSLQSYFVWRSKVFAAKEKRNL